MTTEPQEAGIDQLVEAARRTGEPAPRRRRSELLKALPRVRSARRRVERNAPPDTPASERNRR